MISGKASSVLPSPIRRHNRLPLATFSSSPALLLWCTTCEIERRAVGVAQGRQRHHRVIGRREDRVEQII